VLYPLSYEGSTTAVAPDAISVVRQRAVCDASMSQHR
jgi:hypothetical protein